MLTLHSRKVSFDVLFAEIQADGLAFKEAAMASFDKPIHF
jgi:hypothetical protein